jgi:hypothetical protein
MLSKSASTSMASCLGKPDLYLGRSCRELLQQHFGLHQDRRIEAFGEPSGRRREQIAGCGALALVALECGKASRTTELAELCALLFRDNERLFTRDRFANRLSVRGVVLLPFDVGLRRPVASRAPYAPALAAHETNGAMRRTPRYPPDIAAVSGKMPGRTGASTAGVGPLGRQHQRRALERPTW